MHALRIISRSFLTITLIALALSGAARAEALTDLCLKSGVTVHALRIESRDGVFIITPKGQNSPTVTISADQVKEVGVSCQEAQQSAAPVSTQGPLAAPTGVTQTASGAVRFGVYGSDVIGAKLMPLLIEAWAKKRGWSAVSRPAANGQEIELTAAGASQPSAVVDLKLTEIAEGFAALTDGRAAFAMSTRRATPEEAARMKSQAGVDLLTPSSGAEHVMALDAMAVIVHRDNPVKSLRIDQIADIFSGRAANWKDVHGWNEVGEEVNAEEGPIHVHALDARSESFDLFNAKVLAPAKAELTPAATQHDGGKKLNRAVGKDKNAIGIVPLSYVSKNDSLDINTSCGLAADGDDFSVKIEQYPIMRRLYLYTSGKPKEELLQDLLRFVVSEEGQTGVESAGFVSQLAVYEDRPGLHRWFAAIQANPLNGLIDYRLTGAAKKAQEARFAAPETKKLIARLSEALKEKTGYQHRTSLFFRFETNSSELDARALQDIERLAIILKEREMALLGERGSNFLLAGFADSVGDFSHNERLSKERARRVEDQLRKHGVKLTTDAIAGILKSRLKFQTETSSSGFSSFAPLACNDTDEGRALNRRVEAWIENKSD